MFGRIAVSLLILAAIPCARAQEIFRDDFNGTSFDASKWFVHEFALGRTDFRMGPTIAGGVASIPIDTYDPRAPGVAFSGTELETNASFSRGAGLEFEARIRFNDPLPTGLVAAMFLYGYNSAKNTSDEIDYEFLTNQMDDPAQRDRALLTTFNDWDFDYANHSNDGIHMRTVNPSIPGIDWTQWNTFMIRWLPGRVDWVVNGRTVSSATEAVADEPMSLRFDVWAPGSDWPAAYDAGIQPEANSALNTRYSYEVDSIVVRSIPEPSAAALFLLGMAALSLKAWIRRR
ncbi:MAG: glycoside hydrolase family 16 protein [Verrucomicrobiae bacterium]|nr:glycoside hydrolase family 16 protein [Verrucomicrobiae bacterium]